MQQQVVMATAMVLVVMATGTALVGAECGLIQCRPVNVSMEVESCGIREEVLTTICAGNCYHQDPVYMDYLNSPEQRVCVGDWHYDKHLIQNCPVPVTFPRAHSCSCGPCATQYVDCEHFSHDLPSCLH
ncbi:gonadotropin subunit beta-1-like [Periophthalmus magnuspinnatus]|uniref:gonadotropin subunit beta-1-like n=1 Tax=Periophthalmus magnuspinnatus TaxID=409849 RepID=UPI00145BFCB4|nr:gonadotropin subunit beta-1-like [Periophthalmus magnuspinnatus]